MKLYLGITFILFGCLAPIFSEAHKACLYNCEDAVVLALNKNTIEDTGAWIGFFSLGLEKGQGESFLGINKVDYKIEAGQLFRYTASYGKTWTALSKIETTKFGSWQMTRIPKYHLLNPKAKLTWRVALFPKNREEPVKLPRKGPTTIDLYKSIGINSYRGFGLPLDLSLAATYDKNLGLPAFVSGEKFDLPKFKLKPFVHSINQDLDQLIEPQPNSIFVGSAHIGPKPLSEEVAAAHRVPEATTNCVFSQPQLKNEALNQWLNQARAMSSRFKACGSYFIHSFNSPLPSAASGAIYYWEGDLQTIYNRLKEQSKWFKGPIWYYYNPEQKSWSDELLTTSQSIWREFNIMPMLLPKHSFEKNNHELFSDVLWQKYCTLKLGQYPQKPNSLKQLKSLKLLAPEVYLRKLTHSIGQYPSRALTQ